MLGKYGAYLIYLLVLYFIIRGLGYLLTKMSKIRTGYGVTAKGEGNKKRPIEITVFSFPLIIIGFILFLPGTIFVLVIMLGIICEFLNCLHLLGRILGPFAKFIEGMFWGAGLFIVILGPAWLLGLLFLEIGKDLLKLRRSAYGKLAFALVLLIMVIACFYWSLATKLFPLHFLAVPYIVLSVFFIIYLLATLYFITRPKVREQFN